MLRGKPHKLLNSMPFAPVTDIPDVQVPLGVDTDSVDPINLAWDQPAIMVALLAIGGGLSATFRVLQPAAALTTQYGALLIVKFLLFALALAVAAINRWRVLPGLAVEGTRHYAARRTLVRNVTIEAILLAMALLAAGWLAATAPPAS